MDNKKLYNFISEILTKAKSKKLTSKEVNEKIDIVINVLKIEGNTSSAQKITLLKRYIKEILSNKLDLDDVLKVITQEIDNIKKIKKKEEPLAEPCHSTSRRRQYSITSSSCHSSSSRCGSTSSDRCGSTSSSGCGSSRGSSRC